MPTYECPTCKKGLTVARREDARYRPFCSERCKMVDLGRWLDGSYALSEPMSPEASPRSDGGREDSDSD